METAVSVVRSVCVYNTAGAKILIFLFLNSLNLEFVGMMCKIAVSTLRIHCVDNVDFINVETVGTYRNHSELRIKMWPSSALQCMCIFNQELNITETKVCSYKEDYSYVSSGL